MSVASGVAIGLFLLFVALVAVKNELFTSFRFMNLGGQGAYFADDDALSMDVATTPYVAPTIKPEMLKIAFCVTGQLARLELLSKIAHIFVPNAKMGHLVHLFMLLDDTPEVKQTFWRYDYTNTPHATHSAAKLDHFLARKMRIAGVDGHFHARVRVGPSPSASVLSPSPSASPSLRARTSGSPRRSAPSDPPSETPVVSLSALEEYFLVQGREWERFAWLKSRVVAPRCHMQDAHALRAAHLRARRARAPARQVPTVPRRVPQRALPDSALARARLQLHQRHHRSRLSRHWRARG
jgi:hypothetical protein